MAQAPPRNPAGFLTLTLHAHLPYVVNHGTWPHGMEWLHEAAAETYLPLLRVLRNLERDGIRFNCNLNLSPILLEQLAHPIFLAEFPRYLNRKIVSAQEDEAFFTQSGELHYAHLARFWNRFFSDALIDFDAVNGSIIQGFRHFDETGLISIITCAATHGYMPLLGTDESVRAQVRVAIATHIRHFGKHPRGIWVPECGYRPAGLWNYPVPNADGSPAAPGFDRMGVEQALSEAGLEFFFVDTHLVEESFPVASPYRLQDRHVPEAQAIDHRIYQPHLVHSPSSTGDDRSRVAIFPRDPRTGAQVWSGETGYPGDSVYLDFHKKRWPGGHRYWRVTGPRVDMGSKEPYLPEEAAEKVKHHAAHFAHLVLEALSPSFNRETPPILCSPFDAELFGHWWAEGPLWLEAVARALHSHNSAPESSPHLAPEVQRPRQIQLISCAEFLDRHPPSNSISMHEGSWGAEGNNQVWLNPETSWTYTHIYPAEIYLREVATAGRWRDSDLATRIVQQLCRELLLLESSDWQFLITTGAARDYAEARFLTHNDQFTDLKTIWEAFQATGALTPEQATRLDEINLRDGIFPDIDPAFWSTAAPASPHPEAPPADPTL